MNSQNDLSPDEKLKQAYNLFNPKLPLTGEYADFYVERGTFQVSKLYHALLQSDKPDKLLFTGHRGCGKSTELLRVFEQLQATHFAVLFSILDELGHQNLESPELLLAMSIKLYQAAEEAELEIKADVIESLKDWFVEVTRIEYKEKVATVSAEAGVKAYFLNVLANLKLTTGVREEVRKSERRKLTEFIALMNDLIDEVELRSGKQVLIGIDDLDKLELPEVHDLFRNPDNLIMPNCKIVYTVRLPLIYEPDFGSIARAFAHAEAFTVPVVKLRDREGNRLKEGFELLRDIVARRVELGLFTTTALEMLIGASGGDLRQLVDNVRDGCLIAPIKGRHVIDREVAQAVLADRRNGLRRRVSPADYPKFREIQRTKQLALEERPIYLDRLTVFEYLNDELWYDIHPLLDDILPSQVEEAK